MNKTKRWRWTPVPVPSIKDSGEHRQEPVGTWEYDDKKKVSRYVPGKRWVKPATGRRFK